MDEQRILQLLVTVSAGLCLVGAGCSREDAEYGVVEDLFRATTVSAEVVIEPTPVYGPTPGRWPVAAFDTEQYLVVWEDHRAKRPVLYGGWVGVGDQSLDLEGPLGFPLLDAVPGSKNLSEYQFDVASDGHEFLVVTKVLGEIRGVRVNAGGDLRVFDIASPTAPASRPSVHFADGQFLVAWSQGPWTVGPDNRVQFARVQFLDGPDQSVEVSSVVEVSPLRIPATPVAISHDGTNHLLSWADFDDQAGRVVKAAFVGPDAIGAPFRVSIEGFGSNRIVGTTADFDGSHHVIAWMDVGEDPQSGYEQLQILGNRVTPEGEVGDGIMVAAQPIEAENVHRLNVSADDQGNSVVVWSMDYSGEGGPFGMWIQAAKLAANGSKSMLPSNAFKRALEATKVRHDGGALLLYRDGNDPYDDYPSIGGLWLSQNGLPTNAAAVFPGVTASRQEVKAAASDGLTFLVLWTDTRDSTGEGKALYAGRIAADGTPLGAPIQLSAYPADLADVVFDGLNYVVTWVRHTGGEGDGDPFNTIRISPAGVRLDAAPLPVPLSSPSNTLAGASNGTNTLLVGADSHSWRSIIAAVLIDQSGAVISDILHIVDRGQGLGLTPKVAFVGNSYLVVWHDGRKVYGQRITAGGDLLGEKFIIATGQTFIDEIDVSAGQGKFLVAWHGREEGIRVTRIAANGQPFDVISVHAPERLLYLGCTSNCMSVAHDGEDLVVAWRETTTFDDASTLDLYAAKVRPNGAVIPRFVLSQEPDREGPPVLAGAPDRVLAAYSRYLPGETYDSRRAVVRLIQP